MTRKTSKNQWDVFFQEKIETIKNENRYRVLNWYETFLPGYIIHDKRRFLNLCANDYLGMASDETIKQESKLLAEILPCGAGASRLVTGSLLIHRELEKLLAEWKGTEAALAFPSGYQTNLGVISALVGKGDVIFADRLNHASLIDGCILSGAAICRYRHNDIDELNDLVQTKQGTKKLIVTDGVFSMDGDIAELAKLNKIAKRHQALLLVDDAHGTGLLGKQGAGAWSHCKLKWGKHVILMGTLSKAVGAQGGYVCASHTLIDYLINRCRTMIYSTGLSPLLAGIAHYNISLIRSDNSRIEKLRRNIAIFKKKLASHGFTVPKAPTPIIPIELGKSERALECSRSLYEHGIVASAIRPPTVPEGTARIRLSICSEHEPKDLERAADTLHSMLHNRLK